MDAASVAMAGNATSAAGVGLPNRPSASASTLSFPAASRAPRQRGGPPAPSASGAPRNAAMASPSEPSPPGALEGTQSSGSALVTGDRASTVQSSQSCAGSSGQSERSLQGAATAAAAGSGGANFRVDVTV